MKPRTGAAWRRWKRAQRKRGVRQMRDGEPGPIPLTRWEGQPTLVGQQVEKCCDCGLEHLITYELTKDLTTLWVRAYRLAR